jgi:hypothetical protein
MAGHDPTEHRVRGSNLMGVDREAWPVMVRLALLGLPNRASAWAFFWLSVASAIGCIAYGFVQPLFFIGSLLIFSALWYYLAIRWVDQNGSWR